MTRVKIIGLSVGGLAVFTLIGTALLFWLSGRDVRRIVALQEKLLASDLSKSESNALKTQLMRSIDELDRETLRELQNDMRDQQRKRMETSVAAYHAAVGDEKIAVLDEALDRIARAREVGFDAFGTRRRGMPRGNRAAGNRTGNDTRGDRARRDRGDGRAQQDTARGDRPNRPQAAAGRAGGDPQRRPRAGRGDGGGNRDRQQLSDEQREMYSQYMQALRERAEERGMEWGRRRG